MSSDELWEKFSDCVERVLPREQVMPLFERLETLEKASSIRDVMRLLEVLTRHAPACGYGAGQVRQGLRARGGRDDLVP